MVMMTTKRRDINQDSGETGESITQVRIRVTLDKSSNLAFFFIFVIIIIIIIRIIIIIMFIIHKDYCSHQKIEVGASSELFNNVQRKKCKECVFCRLESEETKDFEFGTKSIGFAEFYINPM